MIPPCFFLTTTKAPRFRWSGFIWSGSASNFSPADPRSSPSTFNLFFWGRQLTLQVCWLLSLFGWFGPSFFISTWQVQPYRSWSFPLHLRHCLGWRCTPRWKWWSLLHHFWIRVILRDLKSSGSTFNLSWWEWWWSSGVRWPYNLRRPPLSHHRRGCCSLPERPTQIVGSTHTDSSFGLFF